MEKGRCSGALGPGVPRRPSRDREEAAVPRLSQERGLSGHFCGGHPLAQLEVHLAFSTRVTEWPRLGSLVSAGALGTQLGGLAALSLPSASVAEAPSPEQLVPSAHEPRPGAGSSTLSSEAWSQGASGGSGGQTGPGQTVCLSFAWGFI